jgi:hypothetical protein
MKSLAIVVVLALAASSAPAQTKTADNSVFGVVRIGETLAVPECSKLPSGKYVGVDSHTCYVDQYIVTAFEDKDPAARQIFMNGLAKRVKSPLRTGMVTVFFDRRPEIVSGTGVSAQVIDGKVEFVKFDTAGVSSADQVFAALKTKYGPPTNLESLTVKTMAGAEFPAVSARWEFDNLVVLFHGASGRVDSGSVVIATMKGIDFETNVAKSVNGPNL